MKKSVSSSVTTDTAGTTTIVPLGTGTEQFRTYLLNTLSQPQPHTTTTNSTTNTANTNTTTTNNDNNSTVTLNFLDHSSSPTNNISTYCTQLLETLVSGGKFRPKIAKGKKGVYYSDYIYTITTTNTITTTIIILYNYNNPILYNYNNILLHQQHNHNIIYDI